MRRKENSFASNFLKYSCKLGVERNEARRKPAEILKVEQCSPVTINYTMKDPTSKQKAQQKKRE